MGNELFQAIVVFIMGCILILTGIRVSTANFWSALVFNFLAIVLGCIGIMMSINMFGL